MKKSVDFVIVGAGIIGLATAKALKKKFSDASITVIEKEHHLGEHASGRNSGVLHAGFYYSANSLKAKLCRQGNKALQDFCTERKIPVNRTGKLVVTKNESELPTLQELFKRGQANEVSLKLITEQEAKEIEPRVLTCQKALWSPTTATVDPSQVLEALKTDLEEQNIKILLGTRYCSHTDTKVMTSTQNLSAQYVVNAAGLYADKIARDFGFGQDYRILPFKGLYLYSSETPGSLKTNIYPVPFLKNPFLGVHFTVTVDGHVKIGPTAIPALWKEQYSFSHRFNLFEALDVCWRELALLFKSDFAFKELAWDEIKKHSKRRLVQDASRLATNVSLEHYRKWGKPGIRAQLVHQKTKKLEQDFILEGDKKSFHILNAVSPAFTCALPFGEFVAEKIDSLIS